MNKKYIIIIFLSIVLISVGCSQSKIPVEEKPNNPVEEKAQIYYEDYQDDEFKNWVIITIYQDDEYEYILGPHKKAYVEYKGKQYSYSKALDENIVTINDLINAGANISKREIDSDKKGS